MTKSVSQFFLPLLFSVTIWGQAQTENRNLDQKLAIQGYDPFAYFMDDKVIEGKASLMVEHDGAIYHFSSEKNQDLFKTDPEKYAPQYGGWCAI